MLSVKGTILDALNRKSYGGRLRIENGRIADSEPCDVEDGGPYLLPGFIDSHIHIESTLLAPSEFAPLAVRQGTVATVSDPHELANVCGVAGIDFMIENGNQVPFKFFFGAPSCVPATPFETSGAALSVADIEALLDRKEILYLAEMMNWPGVLSGEADVLAKIEAARRRNKPVDGHAPGLKGEKAAVYARAGISTDHECFTAEEARDKQAAGMKIAIREGSAARNYEALIPLLDEFPDDIMFCSDDKHPDELVHGHINELAARSLARGCELFDVLRACSVIAVRHYGLSVGLLQPGDPADFIVVDDLETMHVIQTWIDGQCVYDEKGVHLPHVPIRPINAFAARDLAADDFIVPAENDEPQPIIVAYDGELITGMGTERLPQSNDVLLPDVERDLLKIAVVNRYADTPPAVAFIQGIGLKEGALASSVAHDSHNVIIVGTSDEFIAQAANLLMETRGGIAVVGTDTSDILPLPIGGLMSDQPGEVVADSYDRLTRMAKAAGVTVAAPFTLLSFMALLVIPRLKISDKGLFDGETFAFIRTPEQ